MTNPEVLLDLRTDLKDVKFAGVRLGDPARLIPVPERLPEPTAEEMLNRTFGELATRRWTKDKVARMTDGTVITDDGIVYNVRAGRVVAIEAFANSKAARAIAALNVEDLEKRLGKAGDTRSNVETDDRGGRRVRTIYTYRQGALQLTLLDRKPFLVSIRAADRSPATPPPAAAGGPIRLTIDTTSDWCRIRFGEDGWTLVRSEVVSGKADVAEDLWDSRKSVIVRAGLKNPEARVDLFILQGGSDARRPGDTTTTMLIERGAMGSATVTLEADGAPPQRFAHDKNTGTASNVRSYQVKWEPSGVADQPAPRVIGGPRAATRRSAEVLDNPPILLDPTVNLSSITFGGIRIGDAASEIKPEKALSLNPGGKDLRQLLSERPTPEELARLTDGYLLTTDAIGFGVRDGRVAEVRILNRRDVLSKLGVDEVTDLEQRLGRADRVERGGTGAQPAPSPVTYHFLSRQMAFTYEKGRLRSLVILGEP
jgi:hypothetical protein